MKEEKERYCRKKGNYEGKENRKRNRRKRKKKWEFGRVGKGSNIFYPKLKSRGRERKGTEVRVASKRVA